MIQKQDYTVVAYLQGNFLLIYLKGSAEYYSVFNWEEIREKFSKKKLIKELCAAITIADN